MLTSRNQWFTEDGFARQEEVIFAQCDRNKILRPATLLKQCGAMAGFHCDAKGLTYEILYARGHAFLLSRISLQIEHMPVNGDIITLHTWENGTKGPYFQRVFEWVDTEGTLLVSGKSDWVMVNPITHKLCRPDAESAQFHAVCPKEIQCCDCQKIPLPKDGLEDLGSHTVVWSDLDGNNHVHSGNYGDILWDYLPSGLQSRPLHTLLLNYNKEAFLGDTIALLGYRVDEDTYIVEGRTDHGTCFTAKCLFGGLASCPVDVQ